MPPRDAPLRWRCRWRAKVIIVPSLSSIPNFRPGRRSGDRVLGPAIQCFKVALSGDVVYLASYHRRNGAILHGCISAHRYVQLRKRANYIGRWQELVSTGIKFRTCRPDRMHWWSARFDNGHGAYLILSIPELLKGPPEFSLLLACLLTCNGSHLWRRTCLQMSTGTLCLKLMISYHKRTP